MTQKYDCLAENNLPQVMNSTTISKVSIIQDGKSTNVYFETCSLVNKIKQMLKKCMNLISYQKIRLLQLSEIQYNIHTCTGMCFVGYSKPKILILKCFQILPNALPRINLWTERCPFFLRTLHKVSEFYIWVFFRYFSGGVMKSGNLRPF